MNRRQLKSLDKIIEYLYDAEKADFKEYPHRNHIYKDVLIMIDYIRERKMWYWNIWIGQRIMLILWSLLLAVFIFWMNHTAYNLACGIKP